MSETFNLFASAQLVRISILLLLRCCSASVNSDHFSEIILAVAEGHACRDWPCCFGTVVTASFLSLSSQINKKRCVFWQFSSVVAICSSDAALISDKFKGLSSDSLCFFKSEYQTEAWRQWEEVFPKTQGIRPPWASIIPPCWIKCFLGSFGFISRIRLLKSSEECLGKRGQNSAQLWLKQTRWPDFSPGSVMCRRGGRQWFAVS